MPSLDTFDESPLVKMILLGGPGSGKTGSLESLVRAGYDLRIIDMDGQLQSLVAQVKRKCPERLNSIAYGSFRDKFKMTDKGTEFDGHPMAFTKAAKLMDHWKTETEDLGDPASWGPNAVLVLDSLSFFSDAAWNWACDLMPAQAKSHGKDHLQVYNAAQGRVEEIIAVLTSPDYGCNVIVTAHVRPIEDGSGAIKGFPNSIGQKLSLALPRYFSTIAMFETVGAGQNVERTLKTFPTGSIDLRNPAPFLMDKSFKIDNGLADFFAVLRNEKKEKPSPPQPVTAKPATFTPSTIAKKV